MKTSKIFLATALIAGCNWTEFDDLEGDTWVSVQGQPNDDSTDFGIALARGARSTNAGDGGSIAAFGAGDAQYMQLVYNATGSVSVKSAIKLNAQFGVGNLDLQPVVISDPDGNEVALVATTGGDQIAVLHGDTNIVERQIFGPKTVISATYMRVPVPGMPGMTQSLPIVAAGAMETVTSVYPAPYVDYPSPPPRCDLKALDNSPVNPRAVGAAFVTSTTTHDLVVWSDTGALLVYSGGVFDAQRGTACPNPTPPTPPSFAEFGNQLPIATKAAVTTPFMPSRGSHIVMYQDRYALLVGHKDLTNPESFLALYDIGDATTPPTLLGTPVTVPGLRTAQILEAEGELFVVAGYPGETIEGVKSGRVQVYPLSTTTGVSSEARMTLHDASPESDQQFGRAIAVTEYNGQPVIAVAADNEVFFYFRTSLYGETREGK